MKLKEYIKDELFKIILIIVYIILICGLLCAFNFGVQMAALMAVLAAIFFIIMFIYPFFNIYNFMRKIYLLFFVSTSILTFAQSVKKDTVDNKYRRSSLYTMMVTDPTRTHEEAIKEYFSTKLYR